MSVGVNLGELLAKVHRQGLHVTDKLQSSTSHCSAHAITCGVTHSHGPPSLPGRTRVSRHRLEVTHLAATVAELHACARRVDRRVRLLLASYHNPSQEPDTALAAELSRLESIGRTATAGGTASSARHRAPPSSTASTASTASTSTAGGSPHHRRQRSHHTASWRKQQVTSVMQWLTSSRRNTTPHAATDPAQAVDDASVRLWRVL